MLNVRAEMRVIYGIILMIFFLFLVLPPGILVVRSFEGSQGFDIYNYVNILSNSELMTAFANSIKISSITAAITTILAFLIAYAFHFTNIFKPLKSAIKVGILIPMLLPTIT